MPGPAVGDRLGVPLLLLAAGAALALRAEPAKAQAVRGTTRTDMERPASGGVDGANFSNNSAVIVHRDINVDVDNQWDGRHPMAAGVAISAATTVTATTVGSMVNTLPPPCAAAAYPGGTYYRCGSVWYQPQYAGTSITYLVVGEPH